jgi:DNA-binding transcriptional regulator LsrR (DeoR family)
LKEQGLTRKEIAKELGISERHVYSLLADEPADAMPF